jgi:hypothetical protein
METSGTEAMNVFCDQPSRNTDSDVLIDYFERIATAAEELSHYDRALISRACRRICV